MNARLRIVLSLILVIPLVAFAEARRADSRVELKISISDPYQWMEQIESEEVVTWVRSQNAATRRVLDTDPQFETTRARVRALMNYRRVLPPVVRGSTLFVAEGDPTTEGDTSLSVVDARDGSRHVLVSPRLTGSELPDFVRNPTGSVFPSPDGRLVAFRTIRSGSRWVTMRIVETATGRILPDRIEGLFASLAVVAWLPDSSGFYYGRFPLEAARGRQQQRHNHALYLHRVGEPQASDDLVLASTDEPIRWYFPKTTDDSSTLVVTSALGTDAKTRTWIADATTPDILRELFPDVDASISYIGSSGSHLYFQTDENAPDGTIFRVTTSNGSSRTELLRGDPDTILYADLVADRLIVFRNRDAAPRVTIHTLDGRFERELALPPLTTVWGPPTGGIGFVGRNDDSHAYFIASGLFDPGTVYRLDPVTGKTDVFQAVSSSIVPSDYEGRQVFYESRDGTRIPMWLAWKKGRDRSKPSPAIMYAYGALGWSAFPFYQPLIVSWLDNGGIYAMPGIRGGGEYGEVWHQAGIRENRENVLEDYLSAAEWLVAEGLTTRKTLVGNGGSISGALAGEAVVRRPDLFGAMLVDIPVLDLLRFDEFNGARAWIPEFGASDNPEDAANLIRHSPYHLIRGDRCYPPTLVTAGERDETATPHHAYKFTAALQEAQACDNPVMINVVEGAGHNFGTSREQTSETWARQIVFALRSVEMRGGDQE